MKQFICIIMALSLIFVCGCRNKEDSGGDTTVNFYYCSDQIEYNGNGGVIKPEARQVHLPDLDTELQELINVYFNGPVSNNLRSPFPSGVTLKNYSTNNGVLQVILSIQISQLEDYDLTLACACLTKTLLEVFPAEAVEIRAEGGKMGDSISVSMSNNTLLFIDNCMQANNKEP